ncbi:hypothetical protein BU26DRAFT_421837 [Trematosphaeria pertusa]|uniref:Transcription factor Rba50 n=1 Tax=Trematosphaeria pertusa TaxID=390896 RepID=A0A6A6IQ18_9PLEO|nr:uncharacterized protein BU26DRAFT_421837 [Trematosphaeria pertusa]KAF2252644.1 hypothetical protein BU26DRAFT_421837 [Trematosphaeria pertusa]
MSFARGERVHFDFDSGVVDKVDSEDGRPPAPASTAFVGDILERPAAASPPVAPMPKANTTGFPAHKKRVPRVSAFKQQRAATGRGAQANGASEPPGAHMNASEERSQIDEENRQRLAGMSAAEIEQERNDLLSSLSPSLIQKLLNRANIDEGSNERDLGLELPAAPATDDIEPETKPSRSKKVSFAAQEVDTSESPPSQQLEPTPVASSTPASTESDVATSIQPDSDSIHFPKSPQPPDLDPDDPGFLKNLHEKYFPNLPYDPSSLSWMAPIDPADKSSPYHPSQIAFNASDLRFDFKGSLLAPSVAREIPVNKGLHHHADAPEAAGYTIPELAVMARSAVPAQRCVAYQTLGRILYRLGQGEFGWEKEKRQADGPVKVAKDPNQDEEEDEDEVEIDMEDAGSAMAAGLWHCVEEGRVIETLTEEAGREKGHLTAKTYAQEALWNWRRGGGRKRQAV